MDKTSSTHWNDEKFIQIFQLEHHREMKNNIKMDVKEAVYEDVEESAFLSVRFA
jgi:hypothetical protein